MSRLEDWATDRGYAAGWAMVRAMPEFVARNAFGVAATYAARGGGPEQLRKNLARVIGVAPADVPGTLMRASLASYARYWREAFRLPTMDHVALAREFGDMVSGKENLNNALAAGTGAVLALPHSGNWDMAGVWLVHAYGGFATVAERLKPESLYRRFLAYRENLGFEVLPLTGGPRPPFDVLRERLADNRIVCLMAERDLTRSGVTVTFFGEPTRMPAGPAKLGIETQTALMPVDSWFDDTPQREGWRFHIHPPLDCTGGDVSAITQVLANYFAVGIAAHPQDWHMLQPQWLADLPRGHQARLAET